MSELQIALIVLSIVVVGGVLAVNRWQERKLRRQLEAAFESRPDDVLMSPRVSVERVEPQLGSDEALLPPEPEYHLGLEEEVSAVPPAGGPGRETVAAMLDAAPAKPAVEQPAATEVAPASAMRPPAQASPAAAVTTPFVAPPLSLAPAAEPAVAQARVEPSLPVPPPDRVDEMLDYVARIQPADTIPAETLRPFMERSRALGRTLHWLGRQAASREWDEVNLFRISRYAELLIALQLVDHSGAVEGDTLAEFCTLAKDVADRYRATVDCPDPAVALKRAQSLDRLCMEVDALIGLNIVAQGKAELSARRVTELAEAAGMQLGISGEFHYKDDTGRTLFSLANHESTPFTADKLDSLTTRGMTLLFDVPRVANGLAVFDQMAGFGRRLAYELGAQLKDDNHRLLTDAEIQKIRNHLAQIYRRMEEAGIPPGGSRARRLFA